jgi:hypothetical protein
MDEGGGGSGGGSGGEAWQFAAGLEGSSSNRSSRPPPQTSWDILAMYGCSNEQGAMTKPHAVVGWERHFEERVAQGGWGILQWEALSREAQRMLMHYGAEPRDFFCIADMEAQKGKTPSRVALAGFRAQYAPRPRERVSAYATFVNTLSEALNCVYALRKGRKRRCLTNCCFLGAAGTMAGCMTVGGVLVTECSGTEHEKRAEHRQNPAAPHRGCPGRGRCEYADKGQPCEGDHCTCPECMQRDGLNNPLYRVANRLGEQQVGGGALQQAQERKRVREAAAAAAAAAAQPGSGREGEGEGGAGAGGAGAGGARAGR